MADKLVSKKDIIKGWAKYYLCAEVSSGFELSDCSGIFLRHGSGAE